MIGPSHKLEVVEFALTYEALFLNLGEGHLQKGWNEYCQWIGHPIISEELPLPTRTRSVYISKFKEAFLILEALGSPATR